MSKDVYFFLEGVKVKTIVYLSYNEVLVDEVVESSGSLYLSAESMV